LAAELDPDLIQHRHEHVVVEGTLLISGRPDFAHPEAVIVTVQDVKLKSRRREVALFEKPACFVVLLAGHTNFLVSDENAHGRLLFAGSSDSTIGVQRLDGAVSSRPCPSSRTTCAESATARLTRLACRRLAVGVAADTPSHAMPKTQQQEAAHVLRRVVERIDQCELAAAGRLRERLVGAMLALDPGRQSRISEAPYPAVGEVRSVAR